MQALLLDAAGTDAPALAVARELMLDALSGQGRSVNRVALDRLRLAPCQGCRGCWVRTPGVCVIDDGARELAEAWVASDAVIMFTRVTFGGYSSRLKQVLDRIACSLLSPHCTLSDGQVHHRRRYRCYPKLLGLGELRLPDPKAERLFCTLVGRNATKLHAPAHAAGVVTAKLSRLSIRAAVRALLAEAEALA
ncbi:MAG: NAD(P)H-dependent oxidoreductase [Bacillota bacterium]